MILFAYVAYNKGGQNYRGRRRAGAVNVGYKLTRPPDSVIRKNKQNKYFLFLK